MGTSAGRTEEGSQERLHFSDSCGQDHALASLEEMGEKSAAQQCVETKELNDVSGSTVSCINAVLGSGVLALPFAFRCTGVALGILLIACGALASFMSLSMLATCRHRLGFGTYEHGAELAAGSPGRIATSASVILLQVGALVACINILADTVCATASAIVPPSLDPQRPAMKALFVSCILLPICLLVSSGSSLASVSYASVGLVGVFALTLVWFASSPPADELHDPKTPLLMWNGRGALIALPVVLFGFTAHVALLPVLNSLRRPSAPRIRRVLTLSVVLCTVIYTTVGWAGYAAFGRRTAGNVLRNFDTSRASPLQQLAMRLMKAGIAASIVFTVPLVVVPMRETGIAALQHAGVVPSATGTARAQNALTVTYLLGAQALAITVPNVELVFALVGATSSVMLGYILPAVMFCNTFPRDQPDSDKLLMRMPRKVVRVLAVTLAVGGIVVAGTCTYETLERVREERLVVDLAQQVIAKSEAAASAAEAYTSAAGDDAISLAPELDSSGVIEAQRALESVGGSLGSLKPSSDFREAARVLTASSSGLDNTLQRLNRGRNATTSRRAGPPIKTQGHELNGDEEKEQAATSELLRMARDRASGALERIKSVSSSLSRLNEKQTEEEEPKEKEERRSRTDGAKKEAEKETGGARSNKLASARPGRGTSVAARQEETRLGGRQSSSSSAAIAAANANGSRQGDATSTSAAAATSDEVLQKLSEAQKALERSTQGKGRHDSAYDEAADALRLADIWAQRHGRALNASKGRSVNTTAGTVAAASGAATEAVAKDLRRTLEPSSSEPDVLSRVKEIASAVGGERVQLGFDLATSNRTANSHASAQQQQNQNLHSSQEQYQQ